MLDVECFLPFIHQIPLSIQPENARLLGGILHHERVPVLLAVILDSVVPGVDREREEEIALHEGQGADRKPDGALTLD